jgi:hypothetical protein
MLANYAGRGGSPRGRGCGNHGRGRHRGGVFF